MSTITEYYMQAEFALAAYSSLTKGISGKRLYRRFARWRGNRGQTPFYYLIDTRAII